MTYNPRLIENLGSSTDQAIVRFDGTTGTLVETSAITIDDDGNIQLSGTLDGVDIADHAARHESGGDDEIDGDQLDVDFVPSNYVRTTDGYAASTEMLTAHLKGIDAKVGDLDDHLADTAGRHNADQIAVEGSYSNFSGGDLEAVLSSLDNAFTTSTGNSFVTMNTDDGYIVADAVSDSMSLLGSNGIETVADEGADTITVSGAALLPRDGSRAMTGNLDMDGSRVIGLAAPVSDTDAATKAYVDAVVQGLDVKESVKAATTADVVLYDEQTIDGVALVADDRVLVKDQVDLTENGIYVVVDDGYWVRASDADTNAEVTPGMFTFVEQGSVNSDSGWVLSSDTVDIGTTNIVFAQFSGAGTVVAGDGLTKTGNQLDVGAGHGIAVTANDVTVNLDGGTLSKSSSGLKVTDGGITETQLATSVAGAGLSGGDGYALAVNVDDVGIEINSDALRLKDLGVTTAKLDDLAVTADKLAATSVTAAKLGAVAGTGLGGGNGSALTVAYGTVSAVGAGNVNGTANTAARSDHVHAHGNLGGGTLHAVATTMANGFMSSGDKSALTSLIASSISGSGTASQLTYFSGIQSVTSSSKFIVDEPNTRVGIGMTVAMTGTSRLQMQASSSTNTDLAMRLVSDTGTQRLIVNNIGYIGIGTTSTPSRYIWGDLTNPGTQGALLRNVNTGTGASVALTLRNSGATTDTEVGMTSSGFTPVGLLAASTGYLRTVESNLVVEAGGANNLIVGTNSTERMRILSGGNVGIGTTNPSTALHVVGQVLASTGFDANGAKVINVQDPTAAQDAATKAYVDSIAQGLDLKASVLVATTADITLSGTQTIDGVSLIAGDRVLVKNQITATENGIYVVAAGAWARAGDADNSPGEEVSGGMFCFVEAGNTYSDTGWVLSSPDGYATLGTDNLVFTQFSSAGTVNAGDGLSKTGNDLDVNAGDGIEIVSDNVTVKLDGSTLSKSGAGVKVADGAITATQLATSVAGDGLVGGDGYALAVNVDDVGIEIVADALQLKDGGVTTDKLAATSVTAAKLGSDVAGTGLGGGNGAALTVSYGSVGAIGTSSSDGAANTAARSDHVHAHDTFASGDYHTEYLKADGTRALSGDIDFAGYKASRLAVNVSSKSSSDTVLATDAILLADATSGAVTLTLPAASAVSGRVYNFKKIDSSSNNVTIARDGSDTIDGATSFVLDSQYEAITLVSNGSNWFII